jgi:hypothetical protein
MTEKEQIVTDLALLPLDTLRRLKKYSEYMLIPDEDLLTTVNMTQMFDKAMTLADTYFPEWTDRTEGDFGRFLVELFCLFSEKDFYYINGFASESLLSKASIYSNIFTKAVELGYSPGLCRAATVLFNITFAPSPTPFTYNRGEIVIEILSANFASTKVVNLQPVTVANSVTPLTIPVTMYEGEVESLTESFNGYRIDIRKPMIDISSLVVVKDSLPWTRVPVFGQSQAQSLHYMALPEEDGKVAIFFGEDGYGFRPTLGDTFEISYLKCKGSAANTVTGTAGVNRSSPSRPITNIVQVNSISGGTDPESGASIKNNAINYFSTKFVVNNSEAVVRWLNAQPEVKISYAYAQGNNVYFRVQPKDGTIANATLLTTLENRITPFLTNGYTAAGFATTYIDVSPITVSLYHLNGVDVPNMIELAKSLIEDYTNPVILGKYGRGFILTDLDFLLKSKIPLLQNVVFNIVQGNPAASIQITPAALLKKVPTTSITIQTYVVS